MALGFVIFFVSEGLVGLEVWTAVAVAVTSLLTMVFWTSAGMVVGFVVGWLVCLRDVCV
ncbi:hypothetical protein BJ741DRAFT_594854 [Chytriomyces cf. hyalinus JEL632]|nr:hypothetical protein BJ741DRAFT_594854 [Chytriomyces cf. hyalinus JEL632]